MIKSHFVLKKLTLCLKKGESMKRISISTLALINALLFTACANAGVESALAAALATVPASVGVYGTYNTLSDKYIPLFSRHFAQAWTGFSYAMQLDDPKTPSAALNSVLANSRLCFRPHEKMAMIGSASAFVAGVILVNAGSLKALWAVGGIAGTQGDERRAHKQNFKTGITIAGAGLASAAVGYGCIRLLEGHVDSFNQSKKW